jgi:CPSF A subunit region
MIVFGKSAAQMEVTAVEFLPHEKQLYILAADSDKYLHVLQYDPESEFCFTFRRFITILTGPRRADASGTETTSPQQLLHRPPPDQHAPPPARRHAVPAGQQQRQ